MAERLVSADLATGSLSPIVRQRLAVELKTPTSEVGAALKDAVPRSISGTYAARPAANTVPDGSVYYATNVPEAYRSNGTAWSVIGAGGNELATAQLTSPASVAAGSQVDITGLTATFVVGERPIEIRFDGDLKTSLANTAVVIYLMLDGTTRLIPSFTGLAADKFITISKRARIGGLVPGSTHTLKAQWNGGGTMTLNGSTDNPASISVVTL